MILKPRISGDITYKRRWEYFAAIIGVALGYPLYFLTTLIPNYSSDWIYDGLISPMFLDFIGGINSYLSIGAFLLKGILSSLNDLSESNPLYPITFFFISYLEFPSCLAWIIPGFLIGFYRNKQFYNIDIKNSGWKVYWHGVLFIELLMIIFSAGLLIMLGVSFIPGFIQSEALISFFGSGVFYLLLFFISPFFWLGLFLSGLGGFLGTKFAIRKASASEIVVEEVEAEEAFEEEKYLKEELHEIKEKEDMLWPEDAKTAKIEQDIFGIKEVDVESLKTKIKETALTEEPKTIKCPDCGFILPLGAKFCNKCGTKLT